jgi:hypothetical protein
MRFIPMHLCAAREAIGDTNQGHTFQFPPVTTPVHAVEVASSTHPASRGDGFNGSDLSNDLKVHDVSASSSSGLQMHDTDASIITPHVLTTEAEPVLHMSFCPDKPILAGFLGTFAPYPFSALAGRHDNGDVICLTRRTVNSLYPAMKFENE